ALVFLSQRSVAHLSLPSFPTRRSSDLLRAGAETLGDMGAELDQTFGLRRGERLRVGIGDHEFDAAKPGGDHVVDGVAAAAADTRSEEHTSELQSRENLVCRLLLEKKNK